MSETKPRKKVTDYAGLAALITAVGTLAGILWNQDRAETQADMVQESTLAVLQYRLQELEADVDECLGMLDDVQREVWSHHPHSRPASEPAPGASRAPAVESVGDAGGEGAELAEEPLHEALMKARKKSAVQLHEIKDYVQKANKPLSLEDF